MQTGNSQGLLPPLLIQDTVLTEGCCVQANKDESEESWFCWFLGSFSFSGTSRINSFDFPEVLLILHTEFSKQTAKDTMLIP